MTPPPPPPPKPDLTRDLDHNGIVDALDDPSRDLDHDGIIDADDRAVNDLDGDHVIDSTDRQMKANAAQQNVGEKLGWTTTDDAWKRSENTEAQKQADTTKIKQS